MVATARRIRPLVLAGEWNFSCTTGTDIKGVQVSVYRIDRNKPHGQSVVYYTKDQTFASHEEADAWGLRMGFLKYHESKVQ